MKSKKIAIMAFLLLAFANAPANAVTLFYEDFETDLLQWTDNLFHAPKSHSGEIADDPLNSDNEVLHFTTLRGWGDIITAKSFFSSSGKFNLTFDFLGLTAGSSGGYFGYSVGDSTERGNHTWFPRLNGTGTWEKINITFTNKWNTDPIYLIIQDALGEVGDAYFDNILLTDGDGPSPINPNAPVPEPATMVLLGTGLFGMVLYGRKKNMFKN